MPDTDETTTQTEPQSEEVDATPSQEVSKDTTDWKAEARKWEKRAKENSAAAAELEKLKAAAEGTETELDALKAELDTLKADKIRGEHVAAAADKAGVDAPLLARMSGDTEEEIEANAQALKSAMEKKPKYPDVSDGGDGRTSLTASTADQFAHALDQIIG